ncbi:MAG: phosphatase PAP2-related protein [Patescibacteria group bacterium]
MKNKYLQSTLTGILLLILSLFLTSLVQLYSNQVTSNYLSDIILDNVPAFPWPSILVNLLIWGSLGVSASILIIVLFHPGYAPFALKSVALLYFIRAIFISLTHLKVHPGKIPVEYGELGRLLYGSNDLFFSGHTALPLMAALIFWDIKLVRYCLICVSVIFGVSTLLAKSHYSIDVLAVPFMVYGIFVLATKLFKKDLSFENS